MIRLNILSKINVDVLEMIVVYSSNKGTDKKGFLLYKVLMTSDIQPRIKSDDRRQRLEYKMLNTKINLYKDYIYYLYDNRFHNVYDKPASTSSSYNWIHVSWRNKSKRDYYRSNGKPCYITSNAREYHGKGCVSYSGKNYLIKATRYYQCYRKLFFKDIVENKYPRCIYLCGHRTNYANDTQVIMDFLSLNGTIKYSVTLTGERLVNHRVICNILEYNYF